MGWHALFTILMLLLSSTYLRAQDMPLLPSTQTKYINLNSPKQFSFRNDSVQFFADFLGARLNHVYQENDTSFRAVIEAENYPINPSPWYAFKYRNNTSQEITIRLTYKDVNHRYYPQQSSNGSDWKRMDSSLIRLVYASPQGIDTTKRHIKEAILRLKPSYVEKWIAAQPLVVSSDVWDYVNALSFLPYVHRVSIGLSKLGREIAAIRIGKLSEGKPIVLLLSRTHPPEVPGYFALQSFLSRLLDTSALAVSYREQVTTYVIPLLNPDGVDYGHWRHNAGGVDLNRDWSNQNQGEIKQLAFFIEQITQSYESPLIAMLDFHSTHQDIVYTNSYTHRSHLPHFIDSVFCLVEQSLQEPIHLRPSAINRSNVSKGYFYNSFDAESVTYEVGDNTPRIKIHNKAYYTADHFMRLLLSSYLKKKEEEPEE